MEPSLFSDLKPSIEGLTKALILGLFSALLPFGVAGALNGRTNVLGKFYVSDIKGKVTCVVDSRILELKKGDTIPGTGAVVNTEAKANVTLTFSNGTAAYAEEKTRLDIRRFEQELFAPNNNLRVEPSNSLTIIKLTVGRVVLSTPRLQSGTIMLYETPHAMVKVLGEKIMIEVNEQQTRTHVAMIEGNASVTPRGAEGEFVSIGKRLKTGQEAFVTYTLDNKSAKDGAVVDSDVTGGKPTIQSLAEAQAGITRPSGVILAKGQEPFEPNASRLGITRESQATVLKVIGSPSARLPGASIEAKLEVGARLPKDTIVTTDEASEIYLETYPGVISALKPKSTLRIEDLRATTVRDVQARQSAILDLTTGMLVSIICPSVLRISDFSVRTPKGIARAHGTVFSVSVANSGFSVAANEGAVEFATPVGAAYSIEAGNILATRQGAEPSPPITFKQALANDPNVTSLIQTAMSTMADIVRENIGNLCPESVVGVIAGVVSTASAALPERAAGFAKQALAAIIAPTSPVSGNVAAAASAVITAAASAAPEKAAQIAGDSVVLMPGRAAIIAASAAKSAPNIAAEIAAVVTLAVCPAAPNEVSQSSVQTSAAIATAVSAATPDQAIAVATAVMKSIVQSAPQSTSAANAQIAAIIAAGVTGATPTQGANLAGSMLKVLAQISPNTQPKLTAHDAALIASAVTTVVPLQAGEIGSVVMQTLLQLFPPSESDMSARDAGFLTATLIQTAQGSSRAIVESIAMVTGLSTKATYLNAQQNASAATDIIQTITFIAQQVAQSNQQSIEARTSLAQATTAAIAFAGSGSLVSESMAADSGSDTSVANRLGLAAGAELAPSPTGDSAEEAGARWGGAVDRPTSIIVTMYDPSFLNGITAGLQSAIAGQASVLFNSDSAGARPTVFPIPTVPRTLPVENTSSAAFIGPGGG